MKPPSEKGLGDVLSNPNGLRRLVDRVLSEGDGSRNSEQFLRHLADLHGEDPDAVIESLHRDDPLSRVILKTFGVEPKLPDLGGVKADRERHWREYDLLRELRLSGLKGKRLWEALKQRLRTDVDVESLRKSVTRTKKKYRIAIAYSEMREEPVRADRT